MTDEDNGIGRYYARKAEELRVAHEREREASAKLENALRHGADDATLDQLRLELRKAKRAVEYAAYVGD